MSNIGFLPRTLSRLSRGFVVAVHDMPPHRLADLIEGLAPAKPVSLVELVKRRKVEKSCSGLFAITIDDAVGENVRTLAALFRARAWPATFYLPTHYLDTGEPMPFQRWWALKPLLPRRRLKLSSGVIDLEQPGALERLSAKIERAWYRERPQAYLPLTLELAEIVKKETGMKAQEFRGPAPILWREVERLSRVDVLGFESHGVSHTALSALSEEEIAFEMRRSREVISEHTAKTCHHFCYPYGSPEAIGNLAPKLARGFYDSAATMSLGAVDGADLSLLPRIPLYPKNSVWFARIKVGLKCTILRSAGKKTETLSTPSSLTEHL